MPRPTRLPLAALAAVAVAAAPLPAQVSVASPDGRTRVTIEVLEDRLTWRLDRDGRPLVHPSRLGLRFEGQAPIDSGWGIRDTTRSAHDAWWTQPWGEVARVREQYNELAVGAEEECVVVRGPDAVGPGCRRLVLRVRAFDDGIGFRYEVPEQPGFGRYALTEELTQFGFVENPRAWFIPSDRPRMDRSEMLYSAGPVSLLQRVQTPLTMESQDGRTYMVLHEANLVDYPRMNLKGGCIECRTLQADLAPMADGILARGQAPLVTPWRTLQLADRVTDLSPALLGLKLNPPSAIANTGWIHPMKYVGIWWGMHIGTMTWSSGPKHGATTEHTRRYIDFAAANGFGGVLVEGWNTGWDGDWIRNRNAFSFTQAYPDYDLPALAAYARSRGVRLIVHNETSGGIRNYERQLDSAFTLYQSLGLDAIKTGYVTDTIDGGHDHWSQVAVQHHRRVIEAAAAHGIMVDVHEPLHDTGERRTWPNMMTARAPGGRSTTPGAATAATRRSTRPSSSSPACSRARWTTPRVCSTCSSSGAPAAPAPPTSPGCAPRWPSSWRCTWCSTPRCRWPPTCRRTTSGSRPSSSSATWRWTGTPPGCSRAASATTSRWRAGNAAARPGSWAPSRTNSRAPSTSRSRSSCPAAATSRRSTPTAPGPTGATIPCPSPSPAAR
jgi:alpha-glucosidase